MRIANCFQRERSAFSCDSGVPGTAHVYLKLTPADWGLGRDSFEDPALALVLSYQQSPAQQGRRPRPLRGVRRARPPSHQGLQAPSLPRLLRSHGDFLGGHQTLEYHMAMRPMEITQQRSRNVTQMARLPRREELLLMLLRR